MAQRRTKQAKEAEEGVNIALIALVRLLARQSARAQFEASRRAAPSPQTKES